MIFEWGQSVGRDLAGRIGLREYGEELEHVLKGSGETLGTLVNEGLAALDPITQLPFGSRQVFPAGVSIAPIAIGNRAEVMRYKVPLGFTLVVNALQIVYTGGGFVSGQGDFVFRVKVDGRSIDTLANITTNIGTVNTVESVAPFKVSSGQVVSIEAEHVANAALGSSVNGRVGGFIYPKVG